ncbi:hypothetical protein P3W85_38080, partial [Cupriavidus basilensis]
LQLFEMIHEAGRFYAACNPNNRANTVMGWIWCLFFTALAKISGVKVKDQVTLTDFAALQRLPTMLCIHWCTGPRSARDCQVGQGKASSS